MQPGNALTSFFSGHPEQDASLVRQFRCFFRIWKEVLSFLSRWRKHLFVLHHDIDERNRMVMRFAGIRRQTTLEDH
jgi:hypothetical protein